MNSDFSTVRREHVRKWNITRTTQLNSFAQRIVLSFRFHYTKLLLNGGITITTVVGIKTKNIVQ